LWGVELSGGQNLPTILIFWIRFHHRTHKYWLTFSLRNKITTIPHCYAHIKSHHLWRALLAFYEIYVILPDQSRSCPLFSGTYVKCLLITNMCVNSNGEKGKRVVNSHSHCN
jgi:hypothetical protein